MVQVNGDENDPDREVSYSFSVSHSGLIGGRDHDMDIDDIDDIAYGSRVGAESSEPDNEDSHEDEDDTAELYYHSSHYHRSRQEPDDDNEDTS